MRRFIPFILAALIAESLFPQNAVNACKSIHWNANRSEELTWKQSISRNKSLSGVERKRLIDAVSKLLSSADSAAENLESAAKQARIKYVDLKGDGRKEVIVQAGDDSSCSPTGNCPFWIFLNVRGTYTPILDDEAQTFTIQPTGSHGYRDIVLTRHGSAFASDGTELRFDGQRYRVVASFTVEWYGKDREGEWTVELKSPKLSECKVR